MKLRRAGLRIRPWGLRTVLADIEGMTDDVVFLVRRGAYVNEIRRVARRARRLGWLALLLGATTFAWAILRGPGVHSRPAHLALAAIILGWGLFFYVMFQRTRYARAHPFDPGDQPFDQDD